MIDHPDAVLIEVGPSQALTQAARRCAPNATVLPSLPSARSSMADEATLFSTVGRLWTRGVDINWAAFAEPGRERVGLPGYPFQRQRHWIEERMPQSMRRRLPGLWQRVPHRCQNDARAEVVATTPARRGAA